MWRKLACALALSVALTAHAESPVDRIGPADLARIADVAEPEFSVDGESLVYSVTTSSVVEDKRQSDLARALRRAGQGATHPHADARRVASTVVAGQSLDCVPVGPGWRGREDPGLADAGVRWRCAAAHFPEGVEDYAWAPDGKRLAVIAYDPERPPGTAKPRNPPPIVTDRYWFKQDATGYLGARRKHLYIVDLATGKSELLTPGEHDEHVPEWSPDGRYIAYVTKRGADLDRHLNFDIYLIEPRAGAVERQLTRFEGADLEPAWETRPAWSPDGKRIAYLQGGEDKWVYYAPSRLAVVDVASGKEALATDLDRWFARPRWSKDGRSLYVLVEESRVTHLSKVTLDDMRVTWLTSGPRFDVDFAVSGDRLVVLGGGDDRPAELAAVETRGLRALGAHNEWLAGKRLAPVEDVSFRSADGTEIHGFLVKPLDYVAGRRYPTILRLHGGRVYQYSHEFMPDWQA